jgi:hypothetical protein
VLVISKMLEQASPDRLVLCLEVQERGVPVDRNDEQPAVAALCALL